MSRKKLRQKSKHKPKSSTLQQHRRLGKTLKPPLRTLAQMRSVPWLRDVLPDMLWLCSVVVGTPNPKSGMLLVARAIDTLDAMWKDASEAIDGRMTAFDRVPGEFRWPFIERLIDDGIYEAAFSRDFANLLLLYTGAPGLWILEPWRRRITTPDPKQADDYLTKLLPPVSHGQTEMSTHVKFLALRALFKAGKIAISSKVANEGKSAFDLFPLYPDKLTEEQLRFVRPTIRATFLAIAGDNEAGIKWAREFWRRNWALYPCRFPSGSSETDNGTADDESARRKIIEAQAELVGRLEDIEHNFEELAHRSDPDLYSPDRYEVLTGIVGRIVRLVSLLVRNPSLWHAEYGMYILRAAVESLIVFRWIRKREQEDPTIFGQFKDYGRGHLKLLKLHVDEQVASMPSPPEELLEYQRELEEEVNSDLLEEFQDIHLDATFSKKSVRDMANDVGMANDYRFYYAPASSIAHGEWYGLDRYVLDRCVNPAHGIHRSYRAGDRFMLTPYLAFVATNWTNDLVAEYSQAAADRPAD
jgi:hypothetical protein